jgi:hypothetical protein
MSKDNNYNVLQNKNQQKQIFKKLTCLTGKYLLKSLSMGLIECFQKDQTVGDKKIRMTMIKILKNSLEIDITV